MKKAQVQRTITDLLKKNSDETLRAVSTYIGPQNKPIPIQL